MPINERTCKHITEYIGLFSSKFHRKIVGSDFEEKRLKRDPASAVPKVNTKVKEIPKLLLAHKWEVTQDPTGWWLVQLQYKVVTLQGE